MELFQKDWEFLHPAFSKSQCWVPLHSNDLCTGFLSGITKERLTGLSKDILVRSRILIIQGNLDEAFVPLSDYVNMIVQCNESNNPDLQRLAREMRMDLMSTLRTILWYDPENTILFESIHRVLNSLESPKTVDLNIIRMIADDKLQRLFTDNNHDNGRLIP